MTQPGPPYGEKLSRHMLAGLEGVRNMDLRVVSNEHETSWQHEDHERAKFTRLREEADSFHALHLAVDGAFPGGLLTAEAVRGILNRLEAMGFTVKRKENI